MPCLIRARISPSARRSFAQKTAVGLVLAHSSFSTHSSPALALCAWVVISTMARSGSRPAVFTARIILHRSNQHPLRALLLEDVQVVIFLFYRVVGVTQNDDIAGLVGQVLNPTRNLSEKRIGHIEHNQADVLTSADT